MSRGKRFEMDEAALEIDYDLFKSGEPFKVVLQIDNDEDDETGIYIATVEEAEEIAAAIIKAAQDAREATAIHGRSAQKEGTQPSVNDGRTAARKEGTHHG